MFEFDNTANIWRGGAIRNARVAERNAEVAAHNAANARAARAELQQALERNAQLEYELAVEKAHAEGLTAQLDAMKAAAPTCAAMADSGRLFQSGV